MLISTPPPLFLFHLIKPPRHQWARRSQRPQQQPGLVLFQCLFRCNIAHFTIVGMDSTPAPHLLQGHFSNQYMDVDVDGGTRAVRKSPPVEWR